MKPIYRITALSIVCLALVNPQVDARGRNNNSGNQNRTEQSRQPNKQRPGNSGQRPGNNTQVPGNNKPSRPGNNGQHPGNTQQPSRPNHPQFNYGSSQNQRPSDNRRPHDYGRPGGQHHFAPCPPPPRPHMPAANRPWFRPTPPPAFRPAPTWRPFSTILGISLGSAVNFTVNSLINAGYAVTGYNTNAVYVTNVPMLNMLWPDATLYYGNRGGLCGSEFVYSTPAYNLNRYNAVYNSLVSAYGMPVNVSNANGVMTATWWGIGNQFISLSFTSGLAANGATRFFTTLSFGN